MKRIAGFTLVELLVTIGVAAILATIAVPAYDHFISGNRVSSAINDLAASLALARSEAITRGEDVVVCPSEKPLASTPVCNKTAWSKGWLVFSDQDGDGAFGADDDLIRVHGPVRSVGMPDASDNHYIAFNRMGFARPTFNSAGNAPLTIVACPPDKTDAKARALVLAFSGSITTSARKSDGGSYTCP